MQSRPPRALLLQVLGDVWGQSDDWVLLPGYDARAGCDHDEVSRFAILLK